MIFNRSRVAISEDGRFAAKRVLFHDVLSHPAETVKTPSHVGRLRANKHANRRTKRHLAVPPPLAQRIHDTANPAHRSRCTRILTQLRKLDCLQGVAVNHRVRNEREASQSSLAVVYATNRKMPDSNHEDGKTMRSILRSKPAAKLHHASGQCDLNFSSRISNRNRGQAT